MIELECVERAEPLVPCAALALGADVDALAERVLRLPDSRLARLRGVAGRDFMLVCGSADDLPWSEGVRYLGRDPDAPALLLPTAVTLTVPLTLFERAIRRRMQEHARTEPAPWAISFAPWLIIATGGAQAVSRARVLAVRNRETQSAS